MPVVEFYTRKGCHLCEVAKEKILSLRRNQEFLFMEVDIDSNPELRAKYDDQVPVILLNGVFFSRFDVNIDELKKQLSSMN